MPDLDGASVLACARADAAIRMPRCALLAADPERERLDALAADLRVDAVLAKPFTPGTLRAALAEMQNDGVPGAAPPTAPLGGRLAGLHVLVVEDNLLNQEVASYVLQHAGASVDFAGNGRLAVGMLAEGKAEYDAVLMDLQMPVMDGFEAAAAIRAMGLATLPILAMTANTMEEDRRRALQAGMDGYLAKPIDVDELVGALRRVTGRDEALLAGIDLKATLPRFGGSFEGFAAVFRRFARSQDGVAAELRTLLAAGDRVRAGRLLHGLRGVAANLGASGVAAHALDLEQALRGEDEAALAQGLARLEDALATVLEAARGLPPDVSAGATGPGLADGEMEQRALGDALAHLRDLLQNNNMKAMARFESMRPALARLAPAAVPPLADAVATLRFDAAAALIEEMMRQSRDKKEDA
jgi:CheY-like chemotaxis protein